jgi:hypothetical protein
VAAVAGSLDAGTVRRAAQQRRRGHLPSDGTQGSTQSEHTTSGRAGGHVGAGRVGLALQQADQVGFQGAQADLSQPLAQQGPARWAP